MWRNITLKEVKSTLLPVCVHVRVRICSYVCICSCSTSAYFQSFFSTSELHPNLISGLFLEIVTGWPWIFYGLEWASCLPSGCLGAEIVVRYYHPSLLSWAWVTNTGLPLKRIARGWGQQVENTHCLHRAMKVSLNGDRPVNMLPGLWLDGKDVCLCALPPNVP